MANYNVTQDDIFLLKNHKRIHVRVFLLDSDNGVLDTIEGYVTSGDGSDDGNSDIRKTCNFVLHSYDETYNIGEYNRIWMNRRVRIELGFEDWDKIHWYNRGIFLFNSCSYTYNGSTRDINLSCSDLVTTLDGTHGGVLLGNSFLIEGHTYEFKGKIWNETEGWYEGNDIRQAVIDILEQNGVMEYDVCTIGQVSCLQGYATNWKKNRIDTGTTQEEVDRDEANGSDDLENDHGTWHMFPYDLEFNEGVTVWEVLVKIRDLYPGYEMFFDKDGVFVFQLIPICHHERDLLNYRQMQGLVISENTDLDFTVVKNATKVYGNDIETDRYSEDTQIIDAIYQKKELQEVVGEDGEKKLEEVVIEEKQVKSINVNFIIGDDEDSTVLPENPDENIETVDETTSEENTEESTEEEPVTFVKKDGMVIGIQFPYLNELGTEKELEEIDAYLTIKCEGVDETFPITLRTPVLIENEKGVVVNEIIYKNMQYSSFVQQFDDNGIPVEEVRDVYCFKYLKSQNIWVYTGMYQIEGYSENRDENSPFSIDKIGYRLQVLSGGVYADIMTSTLANERAEYENWLTSRLNDTITLECVIIPFLEVNKKIQYKKLSDGTIDSYIVKNFNYSFTDGTMTITMSKFYELDPFIVCS